MTEEFSLSQLIAVYEQLAKANEDLEKLNTEVNQKEQAIQRLKSDVGDMMDTLGLQDMTMADGKKIKIKKEYYGSAAQERMAKIRAYLKRNGDEGILKPDKLKLDDETIKKLPLSLRNSATYSIHAGTLKAHLKKLDEAGKLTKEVQDLFKVHIANNVIVE